MEEEAGEGKIGGEDVLPPLIQEVIIQDKALTFNEASKCLSTLGKDESGLRYAYLKMAATDRKLTDIRIILNFKHLLFLDVSGNYLTLEAIQVVTDLPFLVQLHAQRNFIESAGIREMCFLQDLVLSRNQITHTNWIAQPQLEYLDLNYNQIYEATFDQDTIPELKELELRGNYLFECGGNFPNTVEKLYLAENRISRIIEGDMMRLKNLQMLHLRNNLIRKLNGFTHHLVNLKYLNLRQNRITKLRQFRKLACLPNLQTLIILQNPVSGEGSERGGEDQDENIEEPGEEQEIIDPNRVAILVLLPNLTRINKIPVAYDERKVAKETAEQKYKDIMEGESSDDEIDAKTTTTEYLTEVDGNDSLENDSPATEDN